MNALRLVMTLSAALFATAQAGRVLLAIYALELGAQPFAMGALAAVFSFFPMTLSWTVGRLSDRFGARWLLLFGSIGGALGMLVPYFLAGLPSLYIASGFLGLSFACFTVTLQNLVGKASSPETRAKNFSTFSMVASFTSFVGPMIAGFSIDHIGLSGACLVVVVMSLLPVVLLLAKGRMLHGGSERSGPGESILRILADRKVRRVLIISSLVQFGLDLFQFYLPIYAHSLGLSATAIGLILATFSAAAFVVRTVLPTLVSRYSEETVLAYAFFSGALCFVLLPLFTSTVMLMLIAFVFGLGLGCGPPITMMLTYAQSASGRSGEALGLRMTVNHLSRVIGPMMFGAIATGFGLFPVFWINALMLASGCAVASTGRERKQELNEVPQKSPDEGATK